MDRIEPRCRICRDPGVRRLVNDRLDWHGSHPLGRDKTHRITYADIVRDVAALNEGRDQSARITYDCLWDPRQASLRPCREGGSLSENPDVEGVQECLADTRV